MLDKIKSLNDYTILGEEEMKRYSVLIPFIKQNDNLHILFEKRAFGLRRQPGEISFPGGKVEKNDENVKETAIRETVEELGIEEGDIKIINQLGAFTPSRHSVIYPFIGEIRAQHFQPNKNEVEELFTVPLDFFLNTKPKAYKIKLHVDPEENFPFHLIPGGKNYPWRYNEMREYFYQYEEYVIWGMTAHILYHLIKLIQK